MHNRQFLAGLTLSVLTLPAITGCGNREEERNAEKAKILADINREKPDAGITLAQALAQSEQKLGELLEKPTAQNSAYQPIIDRCVAMQILLACMEERVRYKSVRFPASSEWVKYSSSTVVELNYSTLREDFIQELARFERNCLADSIRPELSEFRSHIEKLHDCAFVLRRMIEQRNVQPAVEFNGKSYREFSMATTGSLEFFYRFEAACKSTVHSLAGLK